MYQLARDLNSDRYDRRQNTDINNSPTRYHSTTALTAFCCLQFSMYLAVRAVGVATLNAFFRKQAKDKRKKLAVQMLRTAISTCRQIYAMIGVELRMLGRFSSNLEDTFAYGSYSSKDKSSM